MKKTFLFVIALFFVLYSTSQTKKIDQSDTLSYNSSIDAVSDTLPDLKIFEDETPMNLTLEYDITAFIKNKMDGEYLDANLKIEYKDYKVDKGIRLKARGNNRRQTCFFPPIYLNFKTDPIETTELKGIKKIKLVTHCSTSKAHTGYLLREYLIYKMYNVISDQSFRVKMLNIKYIDTGKKKRNYEKYGILLEPIELLTQRINSIEVEGQVIREINVHDREADIVSLFQYMIGNTDWRIKGGHNTKFVKSLETVSTKVIPVPYDFDYAGFVDAHYSFPQSWTSIETTKEREYMGYCRDNEDSYLEAINLFIEKKDEIMKTIDEFTYLSEKDKEPLKKYINSFYSMTNRPDRFVSTLKGECRSNDF